MRHKFSNKINIAELQNIEASVCSPPKNKTQQVYQLRVSRTQLKNTIYFEEKITIYAVN